MNMIERVARVICKQHHLDSDSLWQCFQKDACEIIEAMKEPTKEMQLAGVIAAETTVLHAGDHEYSASVSDDAAEVIWQAMIVEALIQYKCENM